MHDFLEISLNILLICEQTLTQYTVDSNIRNYVNLSKVLLLQLHYYFSLDYIIYYVTLVTKYCIVWTFGGGKPWWIWQIIGGLPTFTVQILTMSHDINKANEQELAKVFLHQTFALYGN